MISVKGYELITPISTDFEEHPLTIPAGTKAIALANSGGSGWNTAYNFTEAYLGSVATSFTRLSDNGDHGNVVGAGWTAFCANILARTDDTLHLHCENGGTVAVIYLGAKGALAEATSYDNSGWGGTSYSILNGAPPVAGCNRFIFGAGNQWGGAAPYSLGTGVVSMNGGTPNLPILVYRLGAADQTISLDINPRGSFFGHFAAAVIYESNLNDIPTYLQQEVYVKSGENCSFTITPTEP